MNTLWFQEEEFARDERQREAKFQRELSLRAEIALLSNAIKPEDIKPGEPYTDAQREIMHTIYLLQGKLNSGQY